MMSERNADRLFNHLFIPFLRLFEKICLPLLKTMIAPICSTVAIPISTSAV